MEFRTLGQIIVAGIHAREWWDSIGVPTAGTRLDQIQSYLRELLNPTTPDANPFRDDPYGPDAYRAIKDAAIFGQIARGLSTLSSRELPRRTLRDVLAGSLAASSESEGGTDARNKLVELELAATCASAGFRLVGFDDLKFEFEGQEYVVECKRPSGAKTLEGNIETAYQQVRRRLGDSSKRGLVAIAVEKVFDLDRGFRPIESEADAARIAVDVGRAFRAHTWRFYRRWLDPRVVGIAAIVQFLATTKESAVVYSYQVCVIKLASAEEGQAVDAARLDRMITALRTASSFPV